METLLETAIAAARSAGSFIMTQYGAARVTTKSDNSPVTQADLGAHEHIVRILASTGIPILSEEDVLTSEIFPTSHELWVVDPLDGTKDFIQKTGDFSVMIGLVRDGVPVLSVVYAPALDTLYYAEKGAGAFMERGGETVRLAVGVRTVPELHFIRSRNHITEHMHTVAQKLLVREQMIRGSVGIKAGFLAEAGGDFFFYTGALGIWDVCAPELLVTEAGGNVTDFSGNPLTYTRNTPRIQNGVLFSNNTCHDDILHTIQTCA